MTAYRATRSAIRMREINRCRWSHDHFQAWNDTSVRLVFRSLPLHRLQSCAAGGRQVVGHCPPVCPRHQASWNPLPLPDKRSLPGKERLGRPLDVHIRMQTKHRKTIFPAAPQLVPIPRLFCPSAESPRVRCERSTGSSGERGGTGHDRRVPEPGARGEGRRDRRADCRSLGAGWPVASAGPAAIVPSFRTWAVGEAQI